jgi:hypothetical protein
MEKGELTLDENSKMKDVLMVCLKRLNRYSEKECVKYAKLLDKEQWITNLKDLKLVIDSEAWAQVGGMPARLVREVMKL